MSKTDLSKILRSSADLRCKVSHTYYTNRIITTEHTSSKKRTLSPIRGQHTPCPETHTLREVDTAPEIHCNNTPAEAQPAKVKDGGVTDIRQATKMPVPEGPVNGLVKVTVVDLIGLQTGQRSGDLGQLAAQVDALLVCALRSSREGGELCVDLVQEFGEFAVVECAGLILVVLFKETVQTAKMVCRLWEARLHTLGDIAPFGEGEVDLFRIATLLPGDGAQESDDVVGDVILHGGAVTDGIDVA